MDRVNPEELSTYEDLTNEKWNGKILVRSSSNLYNQSLLASIIALEGEEKAKEWAKGIMNNMAREPQGNDRAQTKGIVAGEGDIAIMNTYYIGKMLNPSDKVGMKFHEASRILGNGVTKTFFKVDFPMIKPAVISGLILVFIDILKELPLTLILRPFNFNTLSTKSYEYASDEMIHEAAISLIIIILISVVAIYLFYKIGNKEEE